MQPFTFLTAIDEDAALAAAARATFLAGGTTLVDLMKLHVERPLALVDINALPLTEIAELPDGSLRVGAMVRNSDMARHELIGERYPLLAEALLSGASPQLRNMATTGGNLLQRTRCYYFRDTALPCNKRDPGSGCGAIDGYNRIHAVLGVSDQCIATHPSDMCVALAALDATVHVRGAHHERSIAFSDFHLAPGDHPEREHALQTGELIVSVDIPPLPFARRSTYVKVRDRASYAFALASAAVALDLENGTIREARVALGGVATTPWRSHEAEAALAGRRADPGVYHAAADAALSAAVPRRHNAFKIALAKRTLVRALARAGALA
ncbi:MAG TPA: xanthine dehydrogenase family protein subunit M [Vicinamibacterales bacterium]|nr:xanthine dehydrogenase family protein subunit M [Vicinamibacterales bacterium]